MIVLDLDLSRANAKPTDYDTDLESPWTQIESLSSLDRNLYYQKQAADVMINRVKEIDSLITSSLNIHLNLGQHFLINTSQTFLTLETLSIESLKNRTIERFEIPTNFTLNISANSSISLRVGFLSFVHIENHLISLLIFSVKYESISFNWKLESSIKYKPLSIYLTLHARSKWK